MRTECRWDQVLVLRGVIAVIDVVSTASLRPRRPDERDQQRVLDMHVLEVSMLYRDKLCPERRQQLSRRGGGKGNGPGCTCGQRLTTKRGFICN